MLIDELFESSQLNELSPYGTIDQAKDSLVSKAKGVFGGGQTEEGNIQAGQLANEYYKQLKRYVGKTMGTGVNLIPYNVLYKFMSGTKLGVDKLNQAKRQQYTTREAAAIILAAARDMSDEYADQVPPQDQSQDTTAASQPEPAKRTRVEPTVDFSTNDKPTAPTAPAANDTPPHVSSFDPVLSGLSPDELKTLLKMI